MTGEGTELATPEALHLPLHGADTLPTVTLQQAFYFLGIPGQAR